jgi:predicted RNase H-like nuclease (RuvC/YqgF family)
MISFRAIAHKFALIPPMTPEEYNTILSKLGEEMTRLSKRVEELEQRNQALEARNQALEARNEELEAENKQLKELLHQQGASKDAKTPQFKEN